MRFRLRTLLAVVTLSAIALAVWSHLAVFDNDRPEIDVLDDNFASLTDGDDSIRLGFTQVGTPVRYTFTIENDGTAELQLDAASLALPTGVSLVGAFPSTIAAGRSAPLTLQLDAANSATISGEISITNNDSDENPFNFTLTGEVWNSTPIAIDDLYSMVQDTLLQVAGPGVLHNDGDADGHSLTAALLASPSNAASFTFNSDGSFDYQPTAGWTGTDSFTYTVSDGYETSEAATVEISVVDGTVPEIDVTYFEDADSEVSVADDTGLFDFGKTALGEPAYIYLLITNLGVADLSIDPASLSLPAGFSVALKPDSIVAPADWTMMTIQLDAEQTGSYSGEVSFTTNDSDEDPYNFTITGEVTDHKPEFEVYDELDRAESP